MANRPGVTRAKKYASFLRNKAHCLDCNVSGRDTKLELHGPDHPDGKAHLRLGNMVSSGYSNAAILAEVIRCHEIGGGWLCHKCHVNRDRSDSVKEASAKSAQMRKDAPPKTCGRCKQITPRLSRKNMCPKCQGRANKASAARSTKLEGSNT